MRSKAVLPVSSSVAHVPVILENHYYSPIRTVLRLDIIQLVVPGGKISLNLPPSPSPSPQPPTAKLSSPGCNHFLSYTYQSYYNEQCNA
ncbi:hypothetical protein HZH68_016459 [Vespula germanica]|uniref:Uncharacterized protein n=1 Tax=Vespula germanica TaxID=30212 RepID=A0A834J530_VESGE|nr:hypothetical protein HZH68_016459 [Vespula germanica]